VDWQVIARGFHYHGLIFNTTIGLVASNFFTFWSDLVSLVFWVFLVAIFFLLLTFRYRRTLLAAHAVDFQKRVHSQRLG
jgi:hypothetical protein